MRSAGIAVALVALLAVSAYAQTGGLPAYGFVRESGMVANHGGSFNALNMNVTKIDTGVYCLTGSTGTYGTLLVTPQTRGTIGTANTGTGNACNPYGGTLIAINDASTNDAVDAPFTFTFLP